MKNYYFTFGTDISHPFFGGWIIIKAENIHDAEDIFRIYFPNKKDPTMLICAFTYSEEEFKNTEMYKNGNFGHRCHGIIGFKSLKNKAEVIE